MLSTSSGRRFLSRIAAVAIAVLVASSLMASPAATASQLTGNRHAPNLVVLGDSYAAGVGNLPYDPASGQCKRSGAAYGPLLDHYDLVTLQAFVACSGATTTQVSGIGPNSEPPQINSITSDTNVVTVQALGNDFSVSTLEALCFSPDSALNCNPGTVLPFPVGHPLYAKTVGEVVASIPQVGAPLMDNLIAAIKGKMTKRGSRLLVVGYPNIVGNGGIYCPTLSPEELPVAVTIAKNLNLALRDAARRNHVTYVSVEKLFNRYDACSLTNAIYPPLPPGSVPAASPDFQGALHPNQFGQGIYAAAVGARLYFG